jgi:transcriptional regulator with XRE-family HTH domain
MDKELAIFLGNSARQARKALQLTQERVAEQLNVSAEFYSRIERGLAHPSIDTFVRMISVLGASADALLGTSAAHPDARTPAAPAAAGETAELQRLIAVLRRARPSTLYLVRALLNELDRASVARKRHDALARGEPPSLPPSPEDE